MDCSLICPLGLTDIIILTAESKMSLQQIVVLVRVLFLACHGMCVGVDCLLFLLGGQTWGGPVNL